MKRGDQEAFTEKVKGDLSVTRFGRIYVAPWAGGSTEEALQRGEHTKSGGHEREQGLWLGKLSDLSASEA